MNETSGVLIPVVKAYLNGEPMNVKQIAAMRAYLRQWINADWPGTGDADLADLRVSVNDIISRDDISAWLSRAEALCIDPL